MTAYLKQAPIGVPGDITRTDETNVEPVMLVPLSGAYPTDFGVPLRMVSGGAQQFTVSLTAADFVGILVREVPSMSGDAASDSLFGPTTPFAKQVQGMGVRGYFCVACTAGTPVRGGVVYVRTVAATGRPIGAFEAAADSGNSFALSTDQATWASDGKDANNYAEIRLRH